MRHVVIPPWIPRWMAVGVSSLMLAGVTLCGAHSVSAQTTEEEAVLGVVQEFFETMSARDVEGALETLIVEGQFISILDAEGASARATPLATYIDRLGTGTSLQEERMWNPVVMVHGRVAVVWTPYDFHNDGELSHCGVDAFSLLKAGQSWKIAGVTYTVEPMGCEQLGQPAR